jgi:hypothetical protein
MGEWMYRSTFFDLGTSWKRVVRFTPLPLYPRGKSPDTHWIGGCVGLRAGLDDVERAKFLTLLGLELRPLGRPARSQSLYRLRYPIFITENVFDSKKGDHREFDNLF